jgi:hypothetical protein
MEMQTVLNSFRELADMPVALGILAAVALRAGWSLVIFFACPVMRGADRLDPEVARAYVGKAHVSAPRFLISMLIGLALSIGGLYALRDPALGPLALGAIILGVFILIAEPSRLSVEENTQRVAAARLEGPDAQALAIDRLRASHIERIAMEVGVAALIGFVILVY